MTSSIKIPVSVIVVTKDEARNLPRCLAALERFDEVVVVDTPDADGSAQIAASFGAAYVPFQWNGAYPKKRQWCLDTLSLKHERVFFVDADEEATQELCDEVARLDWSHHGYYVCAKYVVRDKTLCHGMDCTKLCLFDRRHVRFPVVDDLYAGGMGEIEGHYQPVFVDPAATAGRVRAYLRHHALDNPARHEQRHKGYAQWRADTRQSRVALNDPRLLRGWMKKLYEAMPCKRAAFFVYFYGVKLGVLEAGHNREIYLQKCRYLGL